MSSCAMRPAGEQIRGRPAPVARASLREDGATAGTSGSRTNMGEVVDTIRLAIGAFYEAQNLDQAIADLFADGLTTRELCLAGTRQAFQDIVHAPPQQAFQERNRPLRTRPLQPLAFLSDDLQLVATSGIVLRTLLREGQGKTGHTSPSSSSLLRGICDRLTDHLRHNAIVLVVSAPNSNLQHRSSRILLRHSEHPVQTHEFTPARSAIS